MGINACLWRDILSPCALSSKLKHVLGLGHTMCRIQHIFSATEFLHRISPIKSLTGDWCLKAKTSSLIFDQSESESSTGRDTWPSWHWHLSTVLLFEAQPSLLIIYFPAGRQETDFSTSPPHIWRMEELGHCHRGDYRGRVTLEPELELSGL